MKALPLPGLHLRNHFPRCLMFLFEGTGRKGISPATSRNCWTLSRWKRFRSARPASATTMKSHDYLTQETPQRRSDDGLIYYRIFDVNAERIRLAIRMRTPVRRADGMIGPTTRACSAAWPTDTSTPGETFSLSGRDGSLLPVSGRSSHRTGRNSPMRPRPSNKEISVTCYDGGDRLAAHALAEAGTGVPDQIGGVQAFSP